MKIYCGVEIMEHFITKIHIDKLRHLENMNIELSSEERRHLLLTGKNGSGKTSLLEVLKKRLSAMNYYHWKRRPPYDQYKSGVEIFFSDEENLDKIFAEGKLITAYFPAGRKSNITMAHGVEDVKLLNNYEFAADTAQNLVKYMVHLKTQQAYARQAGDSKVETDIQNWFNRFEDALKILLEDKSIELKYDYKNYNFLIQQTGRLPFGFNELSDGYSSVIQIMSGIMLRMEQNWLLKGTLSEYNFEGIVLIDELETHLHIELQRKILPFLI